MSLYPSTGADQNTSVILTFPGSNAHGIAVSSMLSNHSVSTEGRPHTRIQGSKGEIQIFGGPIGTARPESITIITEGADPKSVEFEIPLEGKGATGMFWEADECARCIKSGEFESDICPLDETLEVMKVMDEVRKQGGLKYPDAIESRDYRP
jgi:hypothetical protein